jgi:hypothetical protein
MPLSWRQVLPGGKVVVTKWLRWLGEADSTHPHWRWGLMMLTTIGYHRHRTCFRRDSPGWLRLGEKRNHTSHLVTEELGWCER